MSKLLSCPIIFNSNKIKLTVHTSCVWVLDLLCVIMSGNKLHVMAANKIGWKMKHSNKSYTNFIR